MSSVESDFEKLLASVRRCQVCAAYLAHGPRPVVRLTENIRVLIISQAPGMKVHQTGLPFNDVSGDRLRAWLQLSREEFYNDKLIGFMPMSFCYPGKARGGDLPPRKECAPLWHEPLRAHLKSVKLTLLVGSYAIARYWKPEEEKKSLADTIRSWNGENIIPLVHPSPRNKRWLQNNEWFESEMLPKVRGILQEALISP